MKKTMSMVQVKANRANARQSTGPKTAVGKASSRWNAMKRGILAREVVLHDPSGGERSDEFQAVHRQFWDELAPVGAVEGVLVERMVTAHWRLRRVLIAERGEIARRQPQEAWCRAASRCCARYRGNLSLYAGGARLRGQPALLTRQLTLAQTGPGGRGGTGSLPASVDTGRQAARATRRPWLRHRPAPARRAD